MTFISLEKRSDCCEQYQELLCTLNKERLPEDQQMLECHLQQCAACASFLEENEMLCSLFHTLPAPNLESGFPIELEALLHTERTIETIQNVHRTDLSQIDLGPLSKKSAVKREAALYLTGRRWTST
jgi:hypothetical protein